MIYILFSQRGRLWQHRRFPWWRYAARYPEWFICTVSECLIESCTRSTITHCSPVIDHAVINVTVAGVQHIDYEYHYVHQPNLCYRVDVPVPRAHAVFIQPSTRSAPQMASAFTRTVLRWVTRGRVKAPDCTSVTVGILSDHGIDVDKDVVSPHQLYQWLLKAGYNTRSI